MDFLRLLAQIRTPALDILFQFCTFFGEDILVTVIICLLYWCVNKQLGYEIGLTFFGSGLTSQAMKLHFRIPRPWILDTKFQAVPSAIPSATGYSFPSGHTQGATALFFPLSLHCKQKFGKCVLYLVFLLVGFSRMYLGCHTPQDVLTGLIMTLIIAYGIHLLMKHLADTPKVNLTVALVLGVASVLTFAYAFFLAKSGVASLDNALDCCKASGAGLAFALGWYFERTFIRFSTDGTTTQKTLRFLFGIGVTLILHLLGKELLPVGLLASAVRYFLVVLWIVCIYPFLIRIKQKRK